MKERPNPKKHYAELGQYTFGPRMRKPKKAVVVDTDPDTTELIAAFAKMKTITMRIPAPIHQLLKKMAARNGGNIKTETGKAITYWVKYLGRIAKKEAEEKDFAAIDEEIAEAEKLLHHIEMQQVIKQLKAKGLKGSYEKYSRRSWAIRHPGKPWPGASITNQASPV